IVHPAPSSTGAGIALAAAALGIVLTLVLGYWATDQFNQIRGGFETRAVDLDAAQHRARLDADNANTKLEHEIAALSKTIADADAEQRTLLDNRPRAGGDQEREE